MNLTSKQDWLEEGCSACSILQWDHDGVGWKRRVESVLSTRCRKATQDERYLDWSNLKSLIPYTHMSMCHMSQQAKTSHEEEAHVTCRREVAESLHL